jgi:hypothetical protein
MSAYTRPTTPARRRGEERRLRDVAFAVIAILALLAVLAAATVVPFARAARPRTGPAMGRFRSCLPSAGSALKVACARHESGSLPRSAAAGRRPA